MGPKRMCIVEIAASRANPDRPAQLCALEDCASCRQITAYLLLCTAAVSLRHTARKCPFARSGV